MTECDLTFHLLRSALDGQTPCLFTQPIEAGTWWKLFRLLQRNHVAALASVAFDTMDATQLPPRDVRVPWIAERDKAINWHLHQATVQQEIVDVMQKHGIETLVLKGTHTAQYYPQAELREFGDLDLYFYDRHDEADRVAREILKVEVSNDAHHHSKYNYHGVTVESHYDFINRHYPPSNKRYEQLLKKLAPSATFEVLFMLRHMACHFAASRITLRELVDWALSCRTLKEKADWSIVQTTIEDFGMAYFVQLLNTIAEKRLGLPIPLPTADSQNLDTKTMEQDIVYGSIGDHNADGLSRLGWKMKRWHALGWKRQMVYSDSSLSLWLASLTSHTMKPQSILHKQ